MTASFAELPSTVPATHVPTTSGGAFPVRRIYCVGRNYAAHAREMGMDPAASSPILFMKPADAVLPGGGAMPYPMGTQDLHHEVELVLALGAGGRDVPEARAQELIYGVAAGIDWTRRDIQGDARAQGHPWCAAKGFDNSAPISPIRPVAEVPKRLSQGRLWLSVNGTMRQDGDVADMILTVPAIIAAVSRLWQLAPGDLIFTGTPEGVGAAARGDVIRCGVEDVGELEVRLT